ncbi:uncharacterized protein LOC132903932 [Amyelois transitella]|uniref:uncharacterized protein LOC132903932 n=1 Tax=Amyelois transitella TaxID=680683 RepID=UPI00299019B7|nr:uncharacterized protein LOC132903932 [Amyelois transitella]
MLYQSHQETLLRNRLQAQQQQHHHQYLSPDHRGTSYPPPSPTRASLKRGLAFSHSFKNPPLWKMGHVNSQSANHAEGLTSLSAGHSPLRGDRSPSPLPVPPPTPVPGPSADKPKTPKDKKSRFVNTSSFFSSGGWHSILDG